jgi:octaprenyl-diphosphate synthase
MIVWKDAGHDSINAIWKNRAAVFTGDNLFTNSVLLLLKNRDYKILQIFSDSIGKVIEGELLQMDKSRKLNLNQNIYFDIIKGKTATLLASACATGAASTFTDQGYDRSIVFVWRKNWHRISN